MFVVFVFYADTFKGVFQFSATKLAVSRETFHCKVYVAFTGCIGVTLFNEFCDEVHDAVHGASCFQPHVGVVHLECSHFVVNLGNHHLCILVCRNTSFMGFGNDFVVHVGVVACVSDVIATHHQILADDVVNQCLIGVTDVCFATDGDTAGVHCHFAFV